MKIDLPVRDYRARYCVNGYRPEGTPLEDGESERCELLLWPAASAPDAVVRLSSEHASWSHRQLDPVAVRQDLLDAWDGDVPSSRVRLYAEDLARTNRAFADALDAAPPAVQRALAYWTVDVACRRAGIADLDWLQEAVRALRADHPLPQWFRPDVVYDRVGDDPQDGQALFLVFGAVGPDAFAAAAGNLGHLLWTAAGEEVVRLRNAARVELDRLLRASVDRDPADSRRPQDCGYADPAPDPYLGYTADLDTGLDPLTVVHGLFLEPGEEVGIGFVPEWLTAPPRASRARFRRPGAGAANRGR